MRITRLFVGRERELPFRRAAGSRHAEGMRSAMESMVPMHFPRLLGLRFLACSLALAARLADAESVALSWDKNSEPDIAGYRIHYGTAAAPDSEVIEVKTASGTIPNLVTGVTYSFAVSAYNTAWRESAYSQPIVYTAGSTRVIPPAVLANISTRTLVQRGESVMIGGFIIDGIVPKKVALRGIGPSLTAAGVSGALVDPVLQVLNSGGSVQIFRRAAG